jgi:hypothetical protein
MSAARLEAPFLNADMFATHLSKSCCERNVAPPAELRLNVLINKAL